MITLPPPFTATRLSGYFWHMTEKRLYSLKSGELKLMAITRANSKWGIGEDGYRVSHLGKKRFLTLCYLNTLTLQDSEIPVNNTTVIKVKGQRVVDHRTPMTISQQWKIDVAARNRSVDLYNQP